MMQVRHFVAAVVLVTMLGCDEQSQSPTAPEPVAELSTALAAAAPLSFSRISVGGQHTCALTFENRAYCWGYGPWGQLGNGTTAISTLRPSAVSGGLRFAQISAGFDHTCAVTTDNRAYCWGDNTTGQLGNGTSNNSRSTPGLVAGGRRYRQIIAGAYYTCAVTTLNVGFCWGRNIYGMLGDGTTTQRLTPVRVRGDHSWRRVIAGGNHTCGVTTSNRAFCWGQNDRGQLGINTFTGRTMPVAVAGGHSFIQVIPGANHTCALNTDNRAYCWGENEQGELGDGGVSAQRITPFPVLGTRRWRQVIPGYLHTCGVTMANVAFCWGFNFKGQNGDGTTNGSNAPVRVAGGHAFNAISTGVQEPPPFVSSDAQHSCALNTDNRAYCWGFNLYGQVGDGTGGPTTNSTKPTPVAVVGP
jgi:alpha-tubulin suppressor-like RCC1 family protein